MYTKQASGTGSFAVSTRGGFADGEWHYVRVFRDGNVAVLEDHTASQLATVKYGWY